MIATEKATQGGEQNEEYLTIREFAELAHVSRQAVYQRMKDLDGFTRQVDKGDGKSVTLINKRATALFDGVKSRQIDRQKTSQSPTGTDKLIDTLLQENERLRDELKAQRETVREVMKDSARRLEEKDAQIAEYATRFAELATQAQQLTAQAQTLHAADKPRLIEGTASPITDDTPPEVEAEGQAAPVPAQQRETQGEGDDKPRRGFWARLFGWD